ncbi:MAG: hypothetical protein HFG26_06575 [Provencibacterium sp.]|jgi:ABC-2 type transport system permease protein|nr:hypothetical protein [Provencibacterium sp.]
MLRIYLKFKAQYLKTEMEYTLNFWMMAVAGVLMRAGMLAVAFVLFRNVPDIAGWNEAEVYFILSLIFLSEGVCNLLFDGVWSLPALVFRGEFDVMLSRPISPLYQLLAYGVGLQGAGLLPVGLISYFLSLHTLGRLNPFSILLMVPFVLCGAAIRVAAILIAASNVFWMRADGLSLTYLAHTVGEYAKYPVSIYPGWMQFILLAVIPYGFIGFVPALILRGERAVLLSLALLGFTALYCLLARAVFYRGIQKYESMGM